jgi:integrase
MSAELGAMREWQPTNRKGLYVRHGARCRAREGKRCSCRPSYRAKRRSPVTGRPEYSRTSKDRSALVTWLEGGEKATAAIPERIAAGPTFGELARRWCEGVQDGSIAKRRGRGPYSPTTWRRYRHSLDYTLLPVRSPDHPLGEGFGERVAAEIEDFEWQLFVDRCARRGLKRSTINNHLAVVNAIYAWAAYPTRRLVARNPARDVELPPGDEAKRLRIAEPAEAAKLLAALDADDGLAYAIAFYGGLRRSEVDRLDWPDVDLEAQVIHVRAAKSRAGRNRRAPFAAPLVPILKAAFLRQGRLAGGRVLGRVGVLSSRLAERADRAWQDCDPPLRRVTLHECRHTYASYLMAAAYTLREIMEYLGHSSLTATERYVKLLPRPEERGPADRLNDYVARATGRSGW